MALSFKTAANEFKVIEPDKDAGYANIIDKDVLSHIEKLIQLFLNSIEVNSSDEEDDLNDDINKAISEIDHYNPKPISLDKDVMMYWEEKKFVYPHLYELARIVHSVPATQVSESARFRH
ncbi:hypothetical protein CVS40_12745 [Lucilia cuprina]|nr:hypothetical protein CVS40_12745 [Lucilia cuprina]